MHPMMPLIQNLLLYAQQDQDYLWMAIQQDYGKLSKKQINIHLNRCKIMEYRNLHRLDTRLYILTVSNNPLQDYQVPDRWLYLLKPKQGYQ